jgi:hypothetical protein
MNLVRAATAPAIPGVVAAGVIIMMTPAAGHPQATLETLKANYMPPKNIAQ